MRAQKKTLNTVAFIHKAQSANSFHSYREHDNSRSSSSRNCVGRGRRHGANASNHTKLEPHRCRAINLNIFSVVIFIATFFFYLVRLDLVGVCGRNDKKKKEKGREREGTILHFFDQFLFL